MHNSTIVLLINDDCRAVKGRYEEGGKESIFKTLDQTVAVDDLVVVESNTRHNMTVVKITEVDIDINFDTETDVKWLVQKVDTEHFKTLIQQENAAISAVQSAERRRKREALRESLFADHADKIHALELAKTEDKDLTE